LVVLISLKSTPISDHSQLEYLDPGQFLHVSHPTFFSF
jgi:hypothetical protein